MFEADQVSMSALALRKIVRPGWLLVDTVVHGRERALHPVQVGEAERLDWPLDAGVDKKHQPRQVPVDRPPRRVPLLRSRSGLWSGTGKDTSGTQALRVTTQPDDAYARRRQFFVHTSCWSIPYSGPRTGPRAYGTKPANYSDSLSDSGKMARCSKRTLKVSLGVLELGKIVRPGWRLVDTRVGSKGVRVCGGCDRVLRKLFRAAPVSYHSKHSQASDGSAPTRAVVARSLDHSIAYGGASLLS